MKNFLRQSPARWLVLLLLLVCIADASARNLPKAVSDAMRKTGVPQSAVGIEVRALDGNKVLTELNPLSAFSPASTMKLLTTDAALELLGPTFTWKTQAYASGSQNGDVLNGNLIIKGGGDPKLVLENFWLFLRSIREHGIREIHGNLLLDRSIFEESLYDPAEFDGDPMKPYNAGPDALLLNFQSFRFHFMPDEKANAVTVAVDPPTAGYKVVAPKLSHGACGDWQGALQATLSDTGANFSGSFPLSCGDRTWYIHPPAMSHLQYFSLVFRRMWENLGGTLAGEVKDGSVPPEARLITEWESPTLPEVIRDMNKYSNNVMARQILLTIGAGMQLPGTAKQGAQAVRDWLAEKGIDAPELVIENGSGLSRTERISPHTMARLLESAFDSPLMPEFISSLPLAGFDGTMRRRLNDRGVAGHAHIKTGSLNDVRAIAGYVLAASGKRYVVVCFINHPNAPRAQEVADALVEWVYANG
jgi:D-alanyl-D-alanine carboxypeptidase/D-alanyl-D-alanine-endopeptidase (penicillin-binding protein 4)